MHFNTIRPKWWASSEIGAKSFRLYYGHPQLTWKRLVRTMQRAQCCAKSAKNDPRIFENVTFILKRREYVSNMLTPAIEVCGPGSVMEQHHQSQAQENDEHRALPAHWLAGTFTVSVKLLRSWLNIGVQYFVILHCPASMIWGLISLLFFEHLSVRSTLVCTVDLMRIHAPNWLLTKSENDATPKYLLRLYLFYYVQTYLVDR